MALGPELGQEADNWTLARLEHESQRIDTYMATLRNRTRALQAESTRLEEEIRGTTEKIRLNKALPYMIAHITEVFALDVKRAEDDLYKAATGRKSCVIRTSTRETVFLMVPGLVDVADLDPSDVVGVSKDSYLIYEKFPPSFDSRIKAMEVEQRPNESYDRCGGLERQIQELTEAVVWPLLSPWKEMMAEIGIQPPKGVLLWGPAGTGKTMLARACAASTSSTFLRLAASQLVQSFVGDGSRLVRNAFELAKAKAPSIIFIDEIDAIGGKRTHGDGLHGEREVQRTMLELLNQLDGFTALESVKVICATNRPDVLDPALMRSGRLDRKIELPMPNEDARQHILRIHSSKMKLADGVNFIELARATDDFNGAMLKAVCTEAGMLALRRGATSIEHQDFVDGIASVQSKKKGVIGYFS